ncbi:MAG TPA: peptidylprolyl isomerase [Gemmatimonadales bacterium]|nr:peptidylprolyl isomerase [Gemmatimonadales bacterium]
MKLGARALLAVLAVALASSRAQAQAQLEVVDRIVAVVGRRAILLSEVDEAINQARAEGLEVPDDSVAYEGLRREFLQRLIDEEVLYARARQDTTIQVTDTEIQQAVDEQYRQVRSQFRSDAELTTALRGVGWNTIEEYRRWLGENLRRQAWRDRYISRLRQEGQLRGGAVTEAEMRRFYDELVRSGRIPRFPPSLSARQIVIAPRPSAEARQAALARAESAAAELARGADFSALARRLSDDPGSREQGGDLGWFRRGQMVREFEDVAFRLRPGVVSPIVRTDFGYHLIIVDRVQPAEVKARHILFSPQITAADMASAMALAESVAARWRGGENFDSLAAAYSDPLEARTVGPVDRSTLTPEFARAFENAEVGAIVGPFVVNEAQPNRARIVVAQLTQLLPERTGTFEELRDRIRSNMQQERAITSLLETLRRRTYIEVRM